MTADGRLSFFGKDPRSTVFIRDGRIFRAGVDVQLSKAILSSAGARRLIEAGTLIGASPVDDGLGGVMLEHRRIRPLTYPGEWSFSMFRDAALTTLAVQEALGGDGFVLKDAHGYNVAFDGCQPVFIDFASIAPADPRFDRWRAGSEFIDAFLRILRIWSRTGRTCALSFLNAVWARADDEALIVAGRTGHRLRSRLQRAYAKAVVATAMTPSARREALGNAGFSGGRRATAGIMLDIMSATYCLSGHPYSIARLRRAVDRLPRPVEATPWASYQDDLRLHRELTPRFRRIVDIVSELGVSDAFEVAGNQGALSEALVERGAASAAICADPDEHAVDALYLRLKARRRQGVTPLVQDVMMPDPVRGRAAKDFSADLVIALAVTHHLILTQGYGLDAIIERIAACGRRFMVIEFMPRGLWDGNSGPEVPAWYTKEWFAAGLERAGRILLCEQIEENRVVFLVGLNGAGAG